MVGLSNLRGHFLWDIIKSWKVKYLIKNIDSLPTRSCFSTDQKVLEDDSESTYIMMEVEKELVKQGSKHRNFELNKFYTFTEDTLNTSAEMFIYLNLCPKFLLDWMKLYNGLLQNAPTDVIVQTLNRIMITGKTKKYKTIVEFSKNIFMKITNKLSLQFQTIEHFSKGYQRNGTAWVDENTPENTTVEFDNLKFLTKIGILK